MANQVIIYSTPTCPYCISVKKYLESKQIPYVEYDVAMDPEARESMIEKSGQMGVPVIDVDGQIIVGFNKSLLDDIL